MSTHSISPAAVPWTSGGMHGLGVTQGQQFTLAAVSSAGNILKGIAPAWSGSNSDSEDSSSGKSGFGATDIIGIAVVAITLLLTALFSRKGPKQKADTTRIAEQVIQALQNNLSAYMNGPRTASSQAQALANFDAGWAFLVSPDGCGSSEMGDPGLRCIFERQPVGTCTQAQANAAHEPLSDCGKYSMARDLRDPIANDPNVKPDPTFIEETGQLIDSVTGGLFSSSTGTGSGGLGWLLLAGLAVFGAFTFGGDGK